MAPAPPEHPAATASMNGNIQYRRMSAALGVFRSVSSVRVGADHFAAGDCSHARQIMPSTVDLMNHASVAEKDIHATGVIAARRHGRVCRASDSLAPAIQVDVRNGIARPAGGLLVR